MDLSERPRGHFRRHPWEVSRARFFRAVTRRFVGRQKLGAVLDVGAGDAWFAGELALDCPPGARIHCWDSGYTDDVVASLAGQRSEMLRFSATRPDGRFSLILLLDVLEHVEDDGAFLRSLVGDSLEQHGFVIISVPAWPSLFSRHDRALGHHRRYGLRDLRDLVQASGASILRIGGLFHVLLPLRVVAKVKESLGGSGPAADGDALEWRHGALLARLVEACLRADNRISLMLSGSPLALPGLSWFAICQKRSS